MRQSDICHVEIRTRDLERAKAFYGSVFEWTFLEGMPGYALFLTGVAPGGGLAQCSDATARLGICNYVLVADCAATGALAASLGATVGAKTDVPGHGSFVESTDPWGNEIAFWQAHSDGEGPPQSGGKNGICWLELAAPNLDAAVGYYTKLLGWKFQTSEQHGDYAWIEHDKTNVGVGLVGGERGQTMKGVLTYVTANDLEEATARVAAHGGRVVFGPEAIPGTGEFTVVSDPDGNQLALFRHAPRA